MALGRSRAPVLLFDGVCNVCHASVQFVLRHEREPLIQFASQQSDAGQALLRAQGLPTDVISVVYIDDDGTVFTRSSAVVRVLRRMRAPWSWLAPLLWLVPGPLRDLGYEAFAAIRYRVFGKRDTCVVPTASQRARFLVDAPASS